MGGSETLRMIYTADRVRASGPTGRSTEPIRGTYRTPYPSATPRSSPSSTSLPLPNLRVCVRVNAHHRDIPQRTAPRRQHNAANTKTLIRSEPKLLCRRTPAGTHAFFAHDHPTRRVYVELLLFPPPVRRSLLLLG